MPNRAGLFCFFTLIFQVVLCGAQKKARYRGPNPDNAQGQTTMLNSNTQTGSPQDPDLFGGHHTTVPTGTTCSVEDLAARWNLKLQTNGKWEGPHPTDKSQAEKDGFVLCPEGNAFTNLGTKYTSLQVAELAGIDADSYEPYAQWKARNGATTPKHTKAPNGVQNGKNAPKTSAKPAAFNWNTATKFDYHDETGVLLYQVGRIDFPNGSKDFRQRRPNGPDRWIYNLDNVRRVLFNLADVMEAGEVIFCEGEKTATAWNDDLKAANLYGPTVATTTAQGGKSTLKTDLSPLHGKAVAISHDNNATGEKQRDDVLSAIGTHATCKVIELPDRGDGGDYVDFRAAGNPLENALEMIKAAPVWAPTAAKPTDQKAKPSAQPETSAVARGPYALNEIGNGQRFADANRGLYLFDYTSNRWRVYVGGVWRYTDGDDVERAAKVIEAQICEEARGENDDDRRSKLYKHAATITKRKTRETMLKDAASELGMSAPPENFDTQLHLFNVQNGTLDLRTGELRPHTATDLLTKISPINFNPHATAPTWTRALELWQSSEEVRLWLQKVIGLTLSGEVFEEMLLLLLGAGNNGKTTLLKTLQKLLGDYAHHAQAESLMKQREGRKAGAPAPDILAFKGARMLTASEIADDAALHSAFVKDATGRDPLTARGCHDNRLQTFTPQFMLWLVGNHKPKIKDTSNGIWRRVKLVPFDVAIAPEQRDPNLAQKLEAELPGILNWALEGLRLYYEEGLQTPPEIEAATQNYRAEQSPLDGFIHEMCELSPTAFVTAADLWEAWKTYCGELDESQGTQTAFGIALKKRNLKDARAMVEGRQTRVWKGVRLKK